MPVMLTESQKKYLRGRGHQLKPVVHVGNAGLSAAVLREIAGALEHHELIKVRVRIGDRNARDTAIESMIEQTGAVLIQRVGHTALIYRPHPEKPRIALPGGRSQT